MSTLDAAKEYDTHSSFQKADGLEMIKFLVPKKGEKILDLGCGTGYLSKVLADLVEPEGQVVAIDPDTERLKVARDKYTASNLQYLEGSSENIPGEEGEYDIVFSNFVIHWIEDKDTLFKNVARSLKTGGKFAFICVVHSESKIIVPPEVYNPVNRHQVLNSMHPIDLDECIGKFIPFNNFEIIKLKEYKPEIKFKNVSAFMESIGPAIAHGRFGEKLFNVEALRRHYGDGEIDLKVPHISAVLQRM